MQFGIIFLASSGTPWPAMTILAMKVHLDARSLSDIATLLPSCHAFSQNKQSFIRKWIPKPSLIILSPTTDKNFRMFADSASTVHKASHQLEPTGRLSWFLSMATLARSWYRRRDICLISVIYSCHWGSISEAAGDSIPPVSCGYYFNSLRCNWTLPGMPLIETSLSSSHNCCSGVGGVRLPQLMLVLTCTSVLLFGANTSRASIFGSSSPNYRCFTRKPSWYIVDYSNFSNGVEG